MKKNNVNSAIFLILFAGGVFSALIYIMGYRNGVVTAGPYLAVLLFVSCCIVSAALLIYGYVLPAIANLNKQMKYVGYGALSLTLGVILFYGFNSFANLTSTTYYLLSGEDRIEAYLAEYKFEEARKANIAGHESDRAENLKKITIAEAKFWAAEGEYDRALKVVDETWGMSDYEWNDSDWAQFRLSIIEDGIDKLCSEKRDFVKAKLLVLKAEEFHRESLNQKIAEYEKIIQPNEK